MPMHFSSDDTRLGSQVGERTPGAGLVADIEVRAQVPAGSTLSLRSSSLHRQR